MEPTWNSTFCNTTQPTASPSLQLHDTSPPHERIGTQLVAQYIAYTVACGAIAQAGHRACSDSNSNSIVRRATTLP